jgi:hypothetical protein
MKVEEAFREEIKEVEAYMTPDGKLYASKDEAVQAYLASQSSGPYWAIGIGLVLLIVMAALIF